MNLLTVGESLVHVKSTPLQLLIVEHSSVDVELMLTELSRAGVQIEHTTVENRQQFHSALKNQSFDAVLSDFRLPCWSGMEVLRELRTIDKDTPFLLITGSLGEEAAVECVKQGVSDYILKEHLSRLPVALRRAIDEKIMRDENSQALEALRLSEARNREQIANSIFGICQIDGDGTIVDGNPALVTILGCDSQSSLLSLNFVRDVFRFPEQYAQIMASCRAVGRVRGAETEWRRCGGQIITVRLHLRMPTDSYCHGAMEFVVEDVTEFRVMERQLRQAQKFEAIGQLAGGVAHDFNNVIGAILGWAEIGFDQNRENTQNADRFARIREQAERAAALTRELLAFARRQTLQPRAMDLNKVTSSLLSFLEKVIPRNILLKVVTAPLEPIKADFTQMEQVLMNLCLNGRDAMPEGGCLVIKTEMADLDESFCRTYPYVKPGRYAVLSISDTGLGMDAVTRERIFEPFFTTKEVGKGTGLGLATVYGIVKQHNGFIHVYSEPSEGSLFRLYFPIVEGGLVAEPGKTTAASLTDLHGTETILFAEDHQSIREMACLTLSGLGYRVLAASDGEEALRICDKETPALAILDVIMPKLGGPAVAVKLYERFKNMPVLYTSGYSQQSDRASLAAVNARFLQKPYSPSMLGRVVREILDHREALEPSAEGAL